MTDLRHRIARAIHRYDAEHAFSVNDLPSEHHYGEADAVLAVLADHDRDAARQTTPAGPCGCGAPATPDAVHCQGAPCYMDQDGGLQTVELPTATARQTTGQDDTHPGYDLAGYPEIHAGPREKCPDPACETDQHANCGAECPAVGQPAEAHDTDRAAVLDEAIKAVLGRVEAYEGMGQDAADRNRERSAIVDMLRRMAVEDER